MSYLVATRGDQIVTAVDAAQVRALFGTIDTPEEALYLATLAGYTLSCSDSPHAQYKTDGGGYRLVVQRRDGTCNDGITEVVLTVSADGTTQEISSRRIKDPQPCAIGRRPQGLCSEVRAADSALGDFFAHAAHLEAASVHAFRHIHEELSELGADAELLARVESARRDEVRHARVTARLARRFGAKVTRARVSPRSPRTVLAMAIENATEGCVRETYGAIVATWQALAAQDPEVRAAMVGIAKDETEHAQLSWDLAAFFDERLTAEEQSVVREARRHALATLRGSLGEPSAALVVQAGLPTGTLALQLLDDSAQELAA
jgi:hypothetical protein